MQVQTNFDNFDSYAYKNMFYRYHIWSLVIENVQAICHRSLSANWPVILNWNIVESFQ